MTATTPIIIDLMATDVISLYSQKRPNEDIKIDVINGKGALSKATLVPAKGTFSTATIKKALETLFGNVEKFPTRLALTPVNSILALYQDIGRNEVVIKYLERLRTNLEEDTGAGENTNTQALLNAATTREAAKNACKISQPPLRFLSGDSVPRTTNLVVEPAPVAANTIPAVAEMVAVNPVPVEVPETLQIPIVPQEIIIPPVDVNKALIALGKELKTIRDQILDSVAQSLQVVTDTVTATDPFQICDDIRQEVVALKPIMFELGKKIDTVTASQAALVTGHNALQKFMIEKFDALEKKFEKKAEKVIRPVSILERGQIIPEVSPGPRQNVVNQNQARPQHRQGAPRQNHAQEPMQAAFRNPRLYAENSAADNAGYGSMSMHEIRTSGLYDDINNSD